VTAPAPALETTGLGRRFRAIWALRSCTLRVPAGRVTALVGPTGAGKTTLLHLAAGLDRPTTGRIEVAGAAPGSEAARSRTAFVAQDAPLYPALSVADTVRLAQELAVRFDAARARRRIADLGLPLERRVGTLSGGQHAQLALTVALARSPALLLLDEPLARLDPLARHDFLATVMAEVAETGMSVLFSSHVVAELERVCDHLVVLSGGAVQVTGDVDDLLAGHRVLTGPTPDAERIAARLPVVLAQPAGGQTRLLVRMSEADQPPVGWRSDATHLEELVLGYLRAPEVSALPGPERSAVPA
jgi:ABC-2 type transport system ATP-binding protein